MNDVINDIQRWQNNKTPIALATVIQTWGSAPRKAGSKMAMTAHTQISGSVSGGCVEGAVYEIGIDVLENDTPQLLHFGVADETAWEVGLACGGIIEVFVERLNSEVTAFVQQQLEKGLAYGVGTIVAASLKGILGKKITLDDNGNNHGTIHPDLDPSILTIMEEALANGQSIRHKLDEETELFVEIHRPPPTLIIVGGVHIAVHLVTIAKELGYRTVLVDPRRAFGSDERFPHVDQLVQEWTTTAFDHIPLTPDTAVALLTHDPKIDDPALRVVLPSKAFYVGALGSKKTQAKRRQRLLDAGLIPPQVARIYGPIGLDLGGRTPPEIALAVMAEIVQVRHQKTT